MADIDIITNIEYNHSRKPQTWITGADIFKMMSDEMHLLIMEFIESRTTKYTESESLDMLELNDSFHHCVGLVPLIKPSGSDIIKDMSLDLLELRQTEEELIRTMQDIKTTCILEVEAEWESTKDKTLSNATKRGVEVDLRLSSDAEYMTASEKHEELHKTIRRDQIELEFQQREFQRHMME